MTDDIAATLPLGREDIGRLLDRLPPRPYQRRVYVWPSNRQKGYEVVAYFLSVVGIGTPGFASMGNLFLPGALVHLVLETEDGRLLHAPIAHCQFLDAP